MNRRAYISVLMAAVSLLAAGCRKNDVKPDEQQQPLCFEASAAGTDGRASRVALVENETDIRTDGLSLFSVLTSNNESAVIIDNARLGYTAADGWTYTPERYWFYGNYTFVGMYPYTDGLSAGETSMTAEVMNGTMSLDSGLRITVENCVLDRDTPDILFASAERTQSADAPMDITPVPLVLNHSASAVGFRLRNTSGTDITAISEISLTGILHKGVMTFTPDASGGTVQWMPEEERVTGKSVYTDNCTVPSGGWTTDAITYHDILDNGYFIVIPQRVAGQNVAFSFTYEQGGSGNSVKADLSAVAALTTWELGKRYIYDITVTRDDILLEIHIVDWKEDHIPLE